MRLFSDADAYDDRNFPHFSKRKYELKHTEEGVFEMSKEVQDLLEERLEERVEDTFVASIKNMMKNLRLTVEQAMDALEVPKEKRAVYAGLVAQTS